MSSSTATMTFAPHQPSPLARTTSPFKDPRPAPTTPGRTAQLWDEYEKRAIENARMRGETMSSSQSQRTAASSISYGASVGMASARSSFDFKFRSRQSVSTCDAVATCKSCKHSITLTSGICEPCKKSVILPSISGESTPPLSSTARNFASTDLQLLQKKLSQEQEKPIRKSTSPKRKSFCPMPSQLLDPPTRLSSLRPPTTHSTADSQSVRKSSLTDPNEPFLRLRTSQTTYKSSSSHPTTPTYPPTTPPSTAHSRSSTRPSSFANPASPTSPQVHIPTHPHGRCNSITPSELVSLYNHSSPPAAAHNHTSISTNGTAYTPPRTTSAWDDWDSDSDSEKAGLVNYLKKAGKGKKKDRERSDSKTSIDSVDLRLANAREEERKKNRESGSVKDICGPKTRVNRRKKANGFVRVISCGGCSDE